MSPLPKAHHKNFPKTVYLCLCIETGSPSNKNHQRPFFLIQKTQFIHLPLIPWSFGNTTTISAKAFWQTFRAQYTHFGIFILANNTSSAKRCVCVLCPNRRDDAGWPGWNPPWPGCISSSIILISPAFSGMTPRATIYRSFSIEFFCLCC